MRVVGVDEFGGPEVVQASSRFRSTHAGPGEVRVRVHAATVNPTDTYTRNGDRAALLDPVARRRTCRGWTSPA